MHWLYVHRLYFLIQLNPYLVFFNRVSFSSQFAKLDQNECCDWKLVFLASLKILNIIHAPKKISFKPYGNRNVPSPHLELFVSFEFYVLNWSFVFTIKEWGKSSDWAKCYKMNDKQCNRFSGCEINGWSLLVRLFYT